MQNSGNFINFPHVLSRKGFPVSPFAERHSSWWFYAGFNEIYRVPEEYGNPFKDSPAPSWLTEDMIKQQYSATLTITRERSWKS